MASWDIEIDCEGLLCPLPVLRARKRLLSLAPGTVVCVRATDAMALVDLPHFCGQAGHDYLGAETEGVVTLHLIRRGTPPE
jgi:tRNA 2-thiouridine synthesizing protein A